MDEKLENVEDVREQSPNVADSAVAPDEAEAAAPSDEAGAVAPPDEAESATPPESAKGRRRRRRLTIYTVTIAVIVVLGIGGVVGFNVWHSQPGFCSTICHSPMEGYVASYQNDATEFLAVHKANDSDCLSCHETTIGEQLHEASIWIQGDYQMDESTNMLATVGVTADIKQCGTADCHDFEQVIAVTENYGGEEGVNPHKSHQGTAIDCSNCHSAHGESYMFCNTCHEYELPAGWVNPK